MQFLRCLCLFLLLQILCWALLDKTPTYEPTNIIFNSILKSGSSYIVEGLKVGLGYVELERNKEINHYWKNFSSKNHLISKEHAIPAKLYIEAITKYQDNKIVLHIRDPRQSIVSLSHHYLHPKERKSWKLFGLPENYYSLTWSQQIDWNIENRLPNMVVFIETWLSLAEEEGQKPDGLKLLWTTYDELITDEVALYNKILDFYEIPRARFKYTPIAKNETVLFRKGDVNEWRTTLSEQQKLRVAEIVPISLLQRFGWEP